MFDGVGNIIHCHSEVRLLTRLHSKYRTIIVCKSPSPLTHGLTIPKINFHSILHEDGHHLIAGHYTWIRKLTPNVINRDLNIICELFTQFKTIENLLGGCLVRSHPIHFGPLTIPDHGGPGQGPVATYLSVH